MSEAMAIFKTETKKRGITIPTNHWTMTIYGASGTGKSLLASILAEWLRELLGFKEVVVVCLKRDLEGNIEYYLKNCRRARILNGLSYRILAGLKNCVLVMEDTPNLLRGEVRRNVVDELLIGKARRKRVFTIAVTQKSLGTRTPLKVVLDSKAGRYEYAIYDDRVSLGNIDWTYNSDVDEEKLELLKKAISKGLRGRVAVGSVGRPVKEDSLRHRCFELFERGKSAKDACELFGFEPRTRKYHEVFVYYSMWKKFRDTIRKRNSLNKLNMEREIEKVEG
jgi:hypothetical protein